LPLGADVDRPSHVYLAVAAVAADAVRRLLARHEFALVERYESQAPFAQHRRTPQFRRKRGN
jgi:quinol monooxygenase YgiN